MSTYFDIRVKHKGDSEDKTIVLLSWCGDWARNMGSYLNYNDKYESLSKEALGFVIDGLRDDKANTVKNRDKNNEEIKQTTEWVAQAKNVEVMQEHKETLLSLLEFKDYLEEEIEAYNTRITQILLVYNMFTENQYGDSEIEMEYLLG